MSALCDHYTTFGRKEGASRRNRRHRRPINRPSLLSFAFPRLKPNTPDTEYGYIGNTGAGESRAHLAPVLRRISQNISHIHTYMEEEETKRGRKWKYFGRNKISARPEVVPDRGLVRPRRQEAFYDNYPAPSRIRELFQGRSSLSIVYKGHQLIFVKAPKIRWVIMH